MSLLYKYGLPLPAEHTDVLEPKVEWEEFKVRTQSEFFLNVSCPHKVTADLVCLQQALLYISTLLYMYAIAIGLGRHHLSVVKTKRMCT